MFAAIIASAVLATTSAPQPVTTIVVDTRHVCGFGRAADFQRARAESDARQLAYKLRAEGRKVVIVKADSRITISRPNTLRVTVPGC